MKYKMVPENNMSATFLLHIGICQEYLRRVQILMKVREINKDEEGLVIAVIQMLNILASEIPHGS